MTETDPIDFYVYADQGAVLRRARAGDAARTSAARPTPRSGRCSRSSRRTRSTTPGSRVVVPHELTHLVFDTAVDNPYHFPPRWLNEGLAVYLSEGYAPSDRRMVEAPATAGDLIPLDGLGGAVPDDRRRVLPGLRESVSAVDYMVRTYGRTPVVS